MMTVVLPDGSELVYDALDIVPVGDRGIPRTVVHRRPAGGNQPAHEITITVKNGVPGVAEFRLIDEAHIRGVEIKLGSVGLDRLVTDWLTKVTYQRGETAGHPDADWVKIYPDTETRRLASVRAIKQARRGTRRRRTTHEHLRKVAETYKAAPLPKHKKVALAFGVDPRTAQRYIEKARAAGLLPPSGKQRKQ
jgi:hypothetical protein